MAHTFPNVNNPFFSTAVPVTFQMQAWEEAAKRRAAAQQLSTSSSASGSFTTSVFTGTTSSTAPGTVAITGTTGGGTAGSGGSTPVTPAKAFENLQGAVTALGSVLNSGQNVNQALGNLATILAAFTQAVAQPGSGSQTSPPPQVNPHANPAPAPPLGIAPPNPRSQHIQLPPGTERAGLPPQPPMKPEPPVGLYPAGAGAPSFWTA